MRFLDSVVKSFLGDAIGTNFAFDAMHQKRATYVLKRAANYLEEMRDHMEMISDEIHDIDVENKYSSRVLKLGNTALDAYDAYFSKRILLVRRYLNAADSRLGLMSNTEAKYDLKDNMFRIRYAHRHFSQKVKDVRAGIAQRYEQ